MRAGSAYAAAVVVLALGLRLYQLGSESLWGDEGYSLQTAENPNPLDVRPLYFLILSEWLKLGGGHNEFLLRLPAALFGAAGVWVLYTLGRRLFGSSVSLLASAFMAVSVLHINHSQEVRMYSLAALTSLLATYFLALTLDRGRARYALAYAAFAFASLLTFPLTVLVLAAHGLFALLYVRAYRPGSFMLLGAQLAVAAAWFPWLLNSMHESADFSEEYIATLGKPTVASVIGLLGQFFLWKWSNPGKLLAAGAFGFSVMAAAIALYGLRGFRRTDAHLALVLLWLIVPLVGTVVLSYGVTNVWMVRYLICASPAFYLLASYGIHSLKNRYVVGTAVLAVVGLTLGRLDLYYARPVRPEWYPAVQYIEAHERPGDVIGIYSPGNRLVFRYYYRGRAEWAPMGIDLSPEEEFGKWNDDRVRKLLAGFQPSGRRLWLVLSKHTYRGGFSIVGYLERRYRVLDHRSYNQLELYLFDAGGRLLPEESLRGGDG